MIHLVNKIFLLVLFSGLFCFDTDAYSYTLNFSKSNSESFDFSINIDISVKDGYYMSSSEADVDKFQFQTRIEWPEKECLEKIGEEQLNELNIQIKN